MNEPNGEDGAILEIIDVQMGLEFGKPLEVLADYREKCVRVERSRVLDAVQAVLDEYAFVATFRDRAQEHVVLAALVETELNRLRAEGGGQ